MWRARALRGALFEQQDVETLPKYPRIHPEAHGNDHPTDRLSSSPSGDRALLSGSFREEANLSPA
jgi:hypothetical protein